MLEMIPQTPTGWTYDIWQDDELCGTVRFGRFTEQGWITLDQRAFRVRKRVPFGRRWLLQADGKTVCKAVQADRLALRFTLTSLAGEFSIQAINGLAPGFRIVRGDQVIGMIHPNHPMTRRVAIECDMAPRNSELAFAFWLVAMTWRRAAEPGLRNKASVEA